MRTEFLCISVLRVALGPRVKLASCKSVLKPPVVFSTDRSKAVVLVLFLLFVALSFFFLYVLIWYICFGFDALTELGAFMRTEFLCISVLKVASGPRVKLASCKSALNPR